MRDGWSFACSVTTANRCCGTRRVREIKTSESGERLPPTPIEQENSMNRKMILVGLAAASLAASAAPASAQGVSVGVGFGDGWYGGPTVGVGFGAPGWGYDDWRYGSYAAAPCTCGTYRSARVAPG